MLQRIRQRFADMHTIKILAEAAERHAGAAGEREPGPEHFLLAALDLPDGLDLVLTVQNYHDFHTPLFGGPRAWSAHCPRSA